MSFREKTCWIMMVLLIALGIQYAQSTIALSAMMDGTAPPVLGLIIGLTVLLIIGAVIGHVFIALTSPTEAGEPEDERDRMVTRAAGNIAGYVLGFGVFMGLWHYVAEGDGNMLFHILVGSLIASQVSEYALSIWYYRKGV